MNCSSRQRALVLAALLAGLALAPAVAGGSTPTPRTSLTDVENDVMCPSCHEPLAVAQSPQAIAERNFISSLVAQGKTKKQIEQIPETQISEWAQANHLPQDAVSSSEGKLMGLGKDIPAVPRDELHAVPEPVWDSQQDSYIYETWLERAKAAVTSGAP